MDLERERERPGSPPGFDAASSSLAAFLLHQCNLSRPSHFGTYLARRPKLVVLVVPSDAPALVVATSPPGPLDITLDDDEEGEEQEVADSPSPLFLDLEGPDWQSMGPVVGRGSRLDIKRGGVVKKNPCLLCIRSFSRPSALAAHVLSHTKEKKFVCFACNKSFGIHSNLRRHAKNFNHEVTGSAGFRAPRLPPPLPLRKDSWDSTGASPSYSK